MVVGVLRGREVAACGAAAARMYGTQRLWGKRDTARFKEVEGDTPGVSEHALNETMHCI